MPIATNTRDEGACRCCADLLRGRLGRRRLLAFAGSAGLLAAMPRWAGAAEGQYDAMLVTCIDPRFPEHSLNYTPLTPESENPLAR